MADRILIKNAIVLTQDPSLGELPRGRHPGRRRHHRGRRAEPVGGRRAGHRCRRRHRDPGLHRHPPPHVGDVDPDVRPGLRADHLLRLDPRQVRSALPAGRRARGEPLGRARVHQRGHHDARRLVAHHEHAGPRGRGDRGAPGHGHPVGVRLRLRQHVAPGLVVRAGLHGQRPHVGRRRRPPAAEAVLQLRRPARHHGASQRAAPASASPTSSATTGSWPRSSASTSRSTSRWTASATRSSRSSRCATWTCCTRTRRTSTARTSPRRSGRSSRDSGGNVSFAPQIEVQMGHGWAPAVTALAHNVPIGLSSDVATTASSDQFTQMRSIFGSERGRKHQEAWDANLDGLEASPGLITSRQVLEWATLGGAKVAGHRRPDRLDHARQEGRPRDHRRVRGQRRAGHRRRRRGGLRGGRLERQDGPRRRRRRSRRTSSSPPRSASRARPSRRRATTSSASSATRSPAGCP